MQGQPLVPLQLAEESLSNKLKELNEDFVNLVFSGIAIQELKKKFTEKDIIIVSHMVIVCVMACNHNALTYCMQAELPPQ